ncbi:hypothetical protein VII00023_22044 [Vibrio ichthyoenteri ATCC 700023]|uniref:Uncharacterized protein n=1 Tax=Vibrio ichthyoenteri ATCC 700023 TaxID=870968 RepID=F9S8X9_9VIBR|nr:hypothetical protein [Vibrio ichthyoenteri]EGU29146.1 hypothetical protein VII00023_22044 [Vibrio ichthyoenteri ATCC 700023]
MNKKHISALVSTIILGSGLYSIAANAAATNGNLSFTFSGTIPALPVAGEGWKFVQADGTTLYVPPSAISFSSADTADGLALTSTSESFYIKPNTGSFTAASNITAQLIANPTIAGTAIKSSAVNTVTTTVTINGVTLNAGSSVDIASPTGTNAHELTLSTVVEIPTEARSVEGGSINVTAPIRFSADVG